MDARNRGVSKGKLDVGGLTTSNRVRELYLVGLSFRPRLLVRSFSWVMIFWWVDLLVEIRLKLSAKGVVITLVWLFMGKPEEVLDFRNAMIALKAVRKISGERGSP